MTFGVRNLDTGEVIPLARAVEQTQSTVRTATEPGRLSRLVHSCFRFKRIVFLKLFDKCMYACKFVPPCLFFMPLVLVFGARLHGALALLLGSTR